MSKEELDIHASAWKKLRPFHEIRKVCHQWISLRKPTVRRMRWEGCVALRSKSIMRRRKVLPGRHTEQMNWSFPIRDCNCRLVQCLRDDHLSNMCKFSVSRAWSMRDSWASESNSIPRRIKFVFGWTVFSGLILKPSSSHVLSLTSSEFWQYGEGEGGPQVQKWHDKLEPVDEF